MNSNELAKKMCDEIRVGDTIYIAYIKEKKICKMLTDCIKVFTNNVTVHGYIYGLYGSWGVPTEVNLKYLNKRFVFTDRDLARKWLTKQLEKKNAL